MQETEPQKEKPQKPPAGGEEGHELRRKIYLAVVAALAREGLVILLREVWPEGPWDTLVTLHRRDWRL